MFSLLRGFWCSLALGNHCSDKGLALWDLSAGFASGNVCQWECRAVICVCALLVCIWARIERDCAQSHINASAGDPKIKSGVCLYRSVVWKRLQYCSFEWDEFGEFLERSWSLCPFKLNWLKLAYINPITSEQCYIKSWIQIKHFELHC